MTLAPVFLLALLAMVAVPTFVWMELHGGNTIDTVAMESVTIEEGADENAGRFVLWVEVAPGDVQRTDQWAPSEATHEVCQSLEKFWLSRGVWAQCGEEL